MKKLPKGFFCRQFLCHLLNSPNHINHIKIIVQTIPVQTITLENGGNEISQKSPSKYLKYPDIATIAALSVV